MAQVLVPYMHIGELEEALSSYLIKDDTITVGEFPDNSTKIIPMFLVSEAELPLSPEESGDTSTTRYSASS